MARSTNYPALRRQLLAAAVSFSSHSDTEVVLALYEREGPAMLAWLQRAMAAANFDPARSRGKAAVPGGRTRVARSPLVSPEDRLSHPCRGLA
jgi:asparagine synthase (glutamine-hydrolysing)